MLSPVEAFLEIFSRVKEIKIRNTEVKLV